METRAPRAPLLQGPALLALPFLLWMAARMDFLVDDAFISYRYGRHLADGHGLVWNIGETPPVEGFSNFLWTVLCAGLERLGLAPETWTRALSALCAALMVALVARLVAARAPREPWSARFAALFAATVAPVAVWSTGGLETMAFTLCVFGVFERLTLLRGEPHWVEASIWAVLAVLTRADGFVWVGMSLAAALASSPTAGRGMLLRAALRVAALTALATLAYLAWRWSYFGALEPNTARIKVAFGLKYLVRGAQYVASLLLCVAALPIVLAAATLRLRRDASGLGPAALCFCASAFAYLVVLGGDWMMMYRMLVPAMPFAALALGAWLAGLRTPLTRVPLGAALVALGVLPCFDVHVVPQSLRERAHFRWSQEFRSEYAMWAKGVVDIAEWIEIGRALGMHTLAGESMAVGNIGAFGYYAPELVIYDTQGLTNREPLTPLAPRAREMPGHDRKVELAAFEKYRPTYLTARIVDARDPWKILPKNHQQLDESGAIVGPNEAARQRFEFVLAPLEPAAGFRPDTALLLFRFRR